MDYKILITGASGQLGQCLYIALSKHFRIKSTSKKNNEELNIEQMDITDFYQVQDIVSSYKPNIIINAAAITDVDYCELNKRQSRDVNVNGLKNLIKASHVSTKIVHFSSDYIYNGSENINYENSHSEPINYYGKTKLESENILIGSNRSYLIFRVSTLFSNYGNNFLKWVYKSLQNNKKISVTSDQLVNPVYADTLCSDLVDIMLLDGSGVYNYGSKDSISKYEFAKLIAIKFNLNANLIDKKLTDDICSFVATRPLNCSLNCDLIEKRFDIELPYLSDSLDNFKNLYYE